jgi:predicted aminopeptidase
MSPGARAARGRRRRVAVAATVLACLVASGCRTVGYVARGGLAEARILWRRQPIAELLERPDLDGVLRERLELVRRVRTFAEDDLGLRVGESYTFADVGGEGGTGCSRRRIRDKLEAYTWWWPVVGRVPYQGYFESGGRAGRGDGARRAGLSTRTCARRARSARSVGFADRCCCRRPRATGR